jgi:hypothetical protein
MCHKSTGLVSPFPMPRPGIQPSARRVRFEDVQSADAKPA